MVNLASDMWVRCLWFLHGLGSTEYELFDDRNSVGPAILMNLNDRLRGPFRYDTDEDNIS